MRGLALIAGTPLLMSKGEAIRVGATLAYPADTVRRIAFLAAPAVNG